MLGEVRELEQKRDVRGRVFEVLRREHLPKDSFGQIYVFTAVPTTVKGNHYHTRKTEWFCVLGGEGELVLYDLASRRCQSIQLSAACPTAVKVPPGVAHAMRNSGQEELIVLAYITEPFDPDNTDTYLFDVLGAREFSVSDQR